MIILMTTVKKMTTEELQGLMHMRKRAFAVKSKKGKGSYNRKEFKKCI